MRALIQNFKKSESGASLVEYAVALIVVTIIGGAGVIALGEDAGNLVQAGCGTVLDGATDAIASGVGTNAGNELAEIDCQ